MDCAIVRFPETRTVFIDGVEGGFTNKRLRVNEGKHTFKLSDPQDYTPKWRRPTVTGTNPIRPMEVIFEKMQVSELISADTNNILSDKSIRRNIR